MNRRFGVEIEAFGITQHDLASKLNIAGLTAHVAGYGGHATSYWKAGHDGSVRGHYGFELVSPPLAGEQGLADLNTAIAVLNQNDAQVNRSCGLHVHVEVADFDLKAIKRLVKSFANNEDIFDALMPMSRRGQNNHYTGSLIGLTPYMTDEERINRTKQFFARVDACRSMQEIANVMGTRYKKLNLLAIFEHGTIEFRHHSGTVNAQKIENWVRFVQAFVEHAHKARSIRPWGLNKMSKTARLKTVLDMIGASNLYHFYKDRIKELKRDTEA